MTWIVLSINTDTNEFSVFDINGRIDAHLEEFEMEAEFVDVTPIDGYRQKEATGRKIYKVITQEKP